MRLFPRRPAEGHVDADRAITVMAPEENFEDVIEEADPIIDSMEFHAR